MLQGSLARRLAHGRIGLGQAPRTPMQMNRLRVLAPDTAPVFAFSPFWFF